MSISFVQPNKDYTVVSVESTDYERADGRHLSRIAWENSRSPEDETPITDIMTIDAPVNELPSLTLHVTCTIFERELFACMRDHVLWARTSRVDDPFNWRIPSSLMHRREKLNDMMAEMKREKEDGFHQDRFRQWMPMGNLTSFTTRLSIRSLVKLIQYLEHLSGLSEEWSNLAVTAMSLREAYSLTAPSYAPSIDTLTKSYFKVDFSPAPQPRDTDEVEVTRFYDTLTVRAQMPFALRAQLIRHRTVMVIDNLTEICSDLSTPIRTHMDVQVAAPTHIWKALVSKRQCWLAQYDIWSQLIGPISDTLGLSENSLPCHDRTCPYAGDADLRLADKDPGPPCPMYSMLSGRKMRPDQFEAAQQYGKDRPEYWQRIIVNCSSRGVKS